MREVDICNDTSEITIKINKGYQLTSFQNENAWNQMSLTVSKYFTIHNKKMKQRLVHQISELRARILNNRNYVR